MAYNKVIKINNLYKQTKNFIDLNVKKRNILKSYTRFSKHISWNHKKFKPRFSIKP